MNVIQKYLRHATSILIAVPIREIPVSRIFAPRTRAKQQWTSAGARCAFCRSDRPGRAKRTHSSMSRPAMVALEPLHAAGPGTLYATATALDAMSTSGLCNHLDSSPAAKFCRIPVKVRVAAAIRSIPSPRELVKYTILRKHGKECEIVLIATTLK